MKEPIWEGVYQTFSEAPADGAGFESDAWVRNSLEKVTALLKAAEEPATVSPVVAYRSSLLPFLTAMVSQRSGPVRILDFGGSLGFTFVSVAGALGADQAIDYHIVETGAVCDAGNDAFAADDRIQFHSSLPEHLDDVDIVHLGSSLQYIESWRELLSDLTRYQPNYFLMTDLNAGDIPTYATLQRYYDSRIPAWFFNAGEVIARMEELQYRLLFRSKFVDSILGSETERPQDNFPAELRLGQACNLLFALP